MEVNFETSHKQPIMDDNAICLSIAITDTRTGEPISGANAYLRMDRTNAVQTNLHGRAELWVSFQYGDAELVITAAGYNKHIVFVPLYEEQKVSVTLFKKESKSERVLQDSELVEAAAKGDQRAYAKLMGRYRDSIYFMIQKMVNNREDADDLTLEAFGKAFSSLGKYSTDFAFSTWLYRIAINNCIDFIRKKRLETFSLDQSPEETESSNPNQIGFEIESPDLDPEEAIIREQRVLLVRNVLDKLNPKYRKLIELRYLKELSYEEISEETDLPLGTVKAQLFRAKELLYNMLRPSRNNL